MIIWLCGPSGSGKTTLATHLAEILNAPIVDADVYRKKWPELGYSKEDRIESCERLLEEAYNLKVSNKFVIVSAIAPYEKWREDKMKLLQIKFIQVDHKDSKGREDDAKFEDIEGLTFTVTL